MIERKRRNDFVRKREFDMLRKMRRSEVLAGQDPGLRPSFFQSSMPSKPDDRATTLKKIDEIEAQMSMQWWKTKHGGNSQQPGANSGFAVSSHMTPDALRAGTGAAPAATSYSRTAPQELHGAAPPATAGAPLMQSVLPDATTQSMGLAPQQPAAQQPAAHQPQPPQRPAAVPPPRPFAPAAGALGNKPPAPAVPDSVPGPSGPPSSIFSQSKQYAIQVEEFAHDPELEEASIRFANGDDAAPKPA
jgi:hypothetical protein